MGGSSSNNSQRPTSMDEEGCFDQGFPEDTEAKGIRMRG